MKQLTEEKIQAFEESLYLNEKSKATVSKYLRTVRKLAEYLQGEELTKPRFLKYREILQKEVRLRRSIEHCRLLTLFWSSAGGRTAR